jgi:hypothetical protein
MKQALLTSVEIKVQIIMTEFKNANDQKGINFVT